MQKKTKTCGERIDCAEFKESEGLHMQYFALKFYPLSRELLFTNYHWEKLFLLVSPLSVQNKYDNKWYNIVQLLDDSVYN